MILEEFDSTKTAVINPDMVLEKMDNFPETVVSVFSHQLFDTIVESLFRQRQFETKVRVIIMHLPATILM